MKRNLIIGGVALVLLLISIKFFPYHCNCQAPNLNTPGVIIDGHTLSVDVADTEALREQGLSGRTSLCAECGMLFVFQDPGSYGFWMKDMNFSLDIVWIDPSLKIIGVEKDLSPSTYPKVYYPSAPVEYVLELPAGSFDKHSFRVGDRIEINR